MFLDAFFGCVFFGFLDASKTVLEPNMAPTLADFGAMLGVFWDIFGCGCGISS